MAMTIRILIAGITLMAGFSKASAQGDAIGKVLVCSGQCTAGKRALQRGSDIFKGETISTGPNSNMQIRYSDNGIIAIRPNSQYHVDDYKFKTGKESESKYSATIVKGQFRNLSGAIGKNNPKDYKVQTNVATIGISGTSWTVAQQEAKDPAVVATYQGNVDVTTESGTANVGPGEIATIFEEGVTSVGNLNDTTFSDAGPGASPDAQTASSEQLQEVADDSEVEDLQSDIEDSSANANEEDTMADLTDVNSDESDAADTEDEEAEDQQAVEGDAAAAEEEGTQPPAE